MAFLIAVAQQKGGAGKTSLTAHLGAAFRQTGPRVGLLDLDPQGSLSAWFGLRQEKWADDDGFILRAAEGWRASTELDRLRLAADIIVIDTPPHAETAARLAIRAADLVLVPCQLSPMDLWACKPTFDLIAAENKTARLVLNRVPPRARLADDLRTILAGAPFPAAAAELGNRIDFAASLAEGLGVTEHAPNAAAAEEIRALVQEISGLVA